MKLLGLAAPVVVLLLGVAIAALILAAHGAKAGPQRSTLALKRIVSGLTALTDVTAPRSEPGKLYVVEQRGDIRTVTNGRLDPDFFLDIRSRVRSGGEQGLLSVAFHPAYATNHRLYVDYTDTNGDTRVVEFRSANGHVDPATARQLLFVKQPYPNHNGGQLEFGPDGLLYVGMGDGGSGGDPENRAQNLKSRLGKLLRINPLKSGARWQIAGYGLRNPWRFSFDRANGNLYIGDVGQNQFEEVDVVPRSSKGVKNYGWSVYEGRSRYNASRHLQGTGRLVWPVAVYSHDRGCSITGGYVYRGSEIPSATGRYFYGDYCSGRIWSFRYAGGKARDLRVEPFTMGDLTSWGEDANGELYLTAKASVYKLTG
ncbi:MAG: hypothetical protein QOE36_1859 [Gaiellaceae bacterium]|nr:hypothetical protein [Gaiellaceae bacterium]